MAEEYSRFDDRTYIDVPAAQHDETLRGQIKEAGARWDSTRKSWYFTPGASNPEFLDQFQKVDPATLTKTVTRYLEISKEQLTPEVREGLKAAKGSFDIDQKLWRVQEVNNQLPQELKKFRMVNYDDLKKKVFVNVPREDRGDKTKTAGLMWDKYHESYYAMLEKAAAVPEQVNGYPVHSPKSLDKKIEFFSLPQARTDKNFREQLKAAGVRWSPTFQSWTFTSTTEQPRPDILKNFEPVSKDKLVKHELLQFDVPAARPDVPNSKEIRDALRECGASWNMNDKCYDFWKPEGMAELPPVLKNASLKSRKAQEQQASQTKKAGYHR